MTRTLVVRIPKPHNKQKEIEALLDTCNRVVVNAGRRGGKTTGVARIAVKKGGLGKKVLYIAPTSDQTDAFWDKCIEWLDDAIATGMVHVNNTKRIITFKTTGGRIQARTGNKPNHLRGTYGDFIILDEYAYQNPIIWEKVCSPMTLDTNATVIFISTPDLRNHFYYMYLMAQVEASWEVVTFSSLDNPHLSKEALDALTRDMTEEDYKQEILAQFVEGEGAVFRFTENTFYTPQALGVLLEQHKGHRLCGGLDWGQKNDSTVLSVGCTTCKKEIGLFKTKHIGYPIQREYIKDWLSQYKTSIELLAEENSIGLPNIEQLWEDGVEVSPFNMTGTSKPPLVHQMKLVIEREEWQFIDDKEAKIELEAYTMKVTPAGHRQFSAPHGLHDDVTTARMLMIHQAISGRFSLA